MSFERIVNRTLMAVHAEELDDGSGRRVLVAIAKMTWALGRGGEVSIADPAQAVREHDVHRLAGEASRLVFPSDLYPEKPGTDVILVGTARPPEDREVLEMDAGVRVTAAHGVVQKGARVYGPRVWERSARGVVPGSPARLGPTPLAYENTYGGVDRSDPDNVLVDWRNPIGSGVRRDRSSLAGALAPQIEDVRRPLTSASPAPAGFGAIPAHWAPRSDFGGTYDDRWSRERAPLAPLDMNPRFFCSAPPDLWSATPLRGDEVIDLLGVTEEGLLRFQPPFYAPVFTCDVRGAARGRPCPTHLDTLLIDADRRRVELTFRAAVAVPRKIQAIDRILIEAEGEIPERLIAMHRERGGSAAGEERA